MPGPAWPGRGLAQCDQRPVRPQRRARSTSGAPTWLSRTEGDEAPDQHHRIGAPLPTHLAADHTEGLHAPVRRLGPSATPVKNQSAKWNNSFYKVPALPRARLCWIDSCVGPVWQSIYAHLVQPDFFLRPDWLSSGIAVSDEVWGDVAGRMIECNLCGILPRSALVKAWQSWRALHL